jgi:hypothetical protein
MGPRNAIGWWTRSNLGRALLLPVFLPKCLFWRYPKRSPNLLRGAHDPVTVAALPHTGGSSNPANSTLTVTVMVKKSDKQQATTLEA